MISFDLTGKVAVVTGASSGLGQQFARALSEQGCDVAILERRKERLEEFIDLTQKILNKYKLRINHSKTEIMESVLYNNSVDFKQIDFDFNSLGNIWETTDEINHLKKNDS